METNEDCPALIISYNDLQGPIPNSKGFLNAPLEALQGNKVYSWEFPSSLAKKRGSPGQSSWKRIMTSISFPYYLSKEGKYMMKSREATREFDEAFLSQGKYGTSTKLMDNTHTQMVGRNFIRFRHDDHVLTSPHQSLFGYSYCHYGLVVVGILERSPTCATLSSRDDGSHDGHVMMMMLMPWVWWNEEGYDEGGGEVCRLWLLMRDGGDVEAGVDRSCGAILVVVASGGCF
ncbi:hypothetical protein Tco_0446848 [Tanacetum coccineum]